MFYYCYQLVLSDHYRAVRHISGNKTVNQAEIKQSILNPQSRYMFYYCYQLVLSDHYRAVHHISGIKTVNQAEINLSILKPSKQIQVLLLLPVGFV